MKEQAAVHEKPEARAWVAGGDGVAAEGDKVRGGSDRSWVGHGGDLVSMVGFDVRRKKRMPRQRRQSSSINYLFSFPNTVTVSSSCCSSSAATTSHVPSSSPLHHLPSFPTRVRTLFSFSFL